MCLQSNGCLQPLKTVWFDETRWISQSCLTACLYTAHPALVYVSKVGCISFKRMCCYLVVRSALQLQFAFDSCALDSVNAYVDHIAVEMYHYGGVSDPFADVANAVKIGSWWVRSICIALAL